MPLREALFEAASPGGWAALASLVGSDDAEQIAAAIGLRPAALSPDQQLPAVRRLIETLARQRPLVIVIEDIHWAEPTLIELLDCISTSASGAIFLLALARPELLAEARRASTTLTLDPLPEADLEQLIMDRATAALDPRDPPDRTESGWQPVVRRAVARRACRSRRRRRARVAEEPARHAPRPARPGRT